MAAQEPGGGVLRRPLRAALLLSGFASGCVPFARLVARRSGVRIADVGTGNPGAANVRRSVGTGAGVLVLVLDAAKGAAPVLVGRACGVDDALLAALVVPPVAGHIAVTGGRGVGTALGGAAAQDPVAIAFVAPIFLGGTLLGVHASSVLASYAAFPVIRIALGRSRRSVLWTAALMTLLTLTRLRGALADGGLDRQVLWERLVHDRGPAPAGER